MKWRVVNLKNKAAYTKRFPLEIDFPARLTFYDKIEKASLAIIQMKVKTLNSNARRI